MENFQVPFREMTGFSTPATSIPRGAEEDLHPAAITQNSMVSKRWFFITAEFFPYQNII
jgi:hypothetical protein